MPAISPKVPLVTAALGYLAFSKIYGRSHNPPPPSRVDQLTHYIPISDGPPNAESFLTLVTDGDRLLTSVSIDGRPKLSAIYINTGEVHRLATLRELASNSLADISRDGSRLLLKSQLSTESEQPLWISPSTGGSRLRIGNVLAHDATWMPDGTNILYANGNDLFVVQEDGGPSTHHAPCPAGRFGCAGLRTAKPCDSP